MLKHFSDHHGYSGNEQEITVREDAPEGLRFAILMIAQGVAMTPKAIRSVVAQVLLVRADPQSWSEYPNVWDEVNRLVENCQWYKVYDIAEALYAALAINSSSRAEEFCGTLNNYFRENGIGWQMAGGRIAYRGSEAFSEATHEATAVLAQMGRRSAANEVQEALRDISRRPIPDVTGAIQHAIAALECTARDVTGEANLTLGRLVPKLALAPPLDTAVDKLWGYASDRARHIREGHTVTTDEAELVVSIACAMCTFLSRRSGG